MQTTFWATLASVLAVAIFAKECPPGQEWAECGSPCTPTCGDPAPMCAAVCKPRCQCPRDAPILHDGGCVTVDECPAVVCPNLVCVDECPGGVVVDSSGCPTCHCKPWSGCHDWQCYNYCPDGRKKDAKGCDTCACLDPDDICENMQCEEGRICHTYMITHTMKMEARCVLPHEPVPCQFPMDQGPCRANEDRWYYDDVKKECLQFSYGGCKGNWNRFDSLEACQGMCHAEPPTECPNLECRIKCDVGLAIDDRGCYLCECGDSDGKPIQGETCPPVCMMYCEHGFKMDKNGCAICECVEPQPRLGQVLADPCQDKNCEEGRICKTFTLTSTDHQVARCVLTHEPVPCQFPMDLGPCRAQEEMWYYDDVSEECRPFFFGGCKGNWNRFDSLEACKNICRAEPPTECPNLECRIKCDIGLAIDDRGCYLCECGDEDGSPLPPTCPPVCLMECDYGFKMDKNGCAVCACAEPPPCKTMVRLPTEVPKNREYATIICPQTCSQYGYERDAQGCKICQCADPCKDVSCGLGDVCKAHESAPGVWETECVDPVKMRSWCTGPLCMIYCEHGNAEDSWGCPMCKCLERDPPPCPPPKPCPLCPRGYSFTEEGCQTCQCLPDPCLNHNCGENKACESRPVPHCQMCPWTRHCLDGFEAQRLSVSMDFRHQELEDGQLDQDAFMREVERRASRIMGIDDEYIRGVRVTSKDALTLMVTFHVVTYGQIDVVRAYRTFTERMAMLEEGRPVDIAGVQLTPQHQSLRSSFSTNPHYTTDDQGDIGGGEDGGDMSTLIIVIACACGGAVFVIVLVSIVVARKKTSKTKDRPASYLYQKAASNEPGTRQSRA